MIRSMYTDNPNHEPSLLMMNSGNMQPIRPSMGSWLTYGLGTENQNLPGFVVLCPGKPVVGPQLWSNSFLPGIYQGTHIHNKTVDPEARSSATCSNRHLSLPAQREQLDLLQHMNQLHLEQPRHRTSSSKRGSPRWRWPSACSSEAQEAFDLGTRIDRRPQAVRRRASLPTPA